MKLELYYRPGCPYCQRVLSFMRTNTMEIPLRDVSKEENRKKLVEVGGMQQVPCLLIDGQAMYESLDIIDWLKKNYQ